MIICEKSNYRNFTPKFRILRNFLLVLQGKKDFMIKRLSTMLTKWWLFTFRNKAIKRVEVGGFVFRFRKYWLDIHAISDNWRMRVRVDMPTYGYLYTALIQGKTEQLHGYIALSYLTTTLITQDQNLVDSISKAIDEYTKRLDSLSTQKAKDVSDIQEQCDTELMRDSISYAKMTTKQRKKHREEMRKQFKDIVNEQ